LGRERHRVVLTRRPAQRPERRRPARTGTLGQTGTTVTPADLLELIDDPPKRKSDPQRTAKKRKKKAQ